MAVITIAAFSSAISAARADLAPKDIPPAMRTPAGPQLAGTGRLADDLYLVAHDDATGRPRLQRRALGTGLAGALLAELMLGGAITAAGGLLGATREIRPPGALAGLVHGFMVAENQALPPRDWLAVFSAHAPRQVAERLAQAGYLTRAASWRLRPAGRWKPVDANCAFAPLVRVRRVLRGESPATQPDVVLAGLASACGLGPLLLQYGPPGARNQLDDAVRSLPPAWRDLVGEVQVAVDSALLSHRL
jgi:hypothetical protein